MKIKTEQSKNVTMEFLRIQLEVYQAWFLSGLAFLSIFRCLWLFREKRRNRMDHSLVLYEMHGNGKKETNEKALQFFYRRFKKAATLYTID